jgi:hypothetical protein
LEWSAIVGGSYGSRHPRNPINKNKIDFFTIAMSALKI